MASDHQLDQALERIESGILPGIASLLDGLVDAAALARPGLDAARYADDIRALTLQVEELAREMDASAPGRGGLSAGAAASAA